MSHRHCKRRFIGGGFTLLEAMFAAMLIGLVIAGLVASSSAFTLANGAGVDMSTAEFLIEEIREKITPLKFDELPVGITNYSPPHDISDVDLADFGAFSQNVTIKSVSSADFSTVQAGSDFKKITVKIIKNGQPISEASWIRAKLE